MQKTGTKTENRFSVFGFRPTIRNGLRLNDNASINNIVRNHNIDGIDQDDFKKIYIDATSEPRNFFMLDLKGKPETRYRHNFLDFISP